MKNNFGALLVLSFAIVIGSTGCFSDDGSFSLRCIRGEGPVISRVIDLPVFTGIKVNGSSNVFLQYGPTQFVEVLGQANILDELETIVDDDVWTIEFDRCIRRHETVEVYITLPFLTSVSLTGSGDVYGENTFVSEQTLELELTGSGSIDLAADYSKVVGKTTGSGNITLEGGCDEFDFTTTGSGDYRAFGLISQKGKVRSTGSGSSQVYAEEELEVSLTGSGDVYYKGNPLIDASVTGTGKLINAN